MVEEYNTQASKLRNSYGQPVEEFELQFIAGESIDADLFKALGVHQGNFPAYLEAVEEWSVDDKIKVIIAVGEAGYPRSLQNQSRPNRRLCAMATSWGKPRQLRTHPPGIPILLINDQKHSHFKCLCKVRFSRS